MATGHDREDQIRAGRARAVGLFRYSLIREAADERLSTKQRGRLVRALAEAEHTGPFGQRVRVSRETIDRWIRAWRRGGSTRWCRPRAGYRRAPRQTCSTSRSR